MGHDFVSESDTCNEPPFSLLWLRSEPAQCLTVHVLKKMPNVV